MSIEKTLDERGSRYGEFPEHARITQALKDVMVVAPKWSQLRPDQREALEMIQHKVGRILNGDPDYHDSWHDIVGYAKLVADDLLKRQSVVAGAAEAEAKPKQQVNGPTQQDHEQRIRSMLESLFGGELRRIELCDCPACKARRDEPARG